MSFTSDFLVGVAEYLAANAVGVWHATGAYAKTDTAIVIRTMPQAPDRVISLDTYTVSDDAVLANSTLGVQMLTRSGSDPRQVEDLDDALFDCLHGATNLRLNGIFVTQVMRQSNAPLGQDGSSRWQSTSNFYFDVNRPSRHRPD